MQRQWKAKKLVPKTFLYLRNHLPTVVAQLVINYLDLFEWKEIWQKNVPLGSVQNITVLDEHRFLLHCFPNFTCVVNCSNNEVIPVDDTEIHSIWCLKYNVPNVEADDFLSALKQCNDAMICDDFVVVAEIGCLKFIHGPSQVMTAFPDITCQSVNLLHQGLIVNMAHLFFIHNQKIHLWPDFIRGKNSPCFLVKWIYREPFLCAVQRAGDFFSITRWDVTTSQRPRSTISILIPNWQPDSYMAQLDVFPNGTLVMLVSAKKKKAKKQMLITVDLEGNKKWIYCDAQDCRVIGSKLLLVYHDRCTMLA
jgi:hypothetical protein